MRRRKSVWVDPFWNALAVYNAECARGIVHTAEYAAEMAKRQEMWNRRNAPGVDWLPKRTLPDVTA